MSQLFFLEKENWRKRWLKKYPPRRAGQVASIKTPLEARAEIPAAAGRQTRL
jgi:hypothetical protein